MEAKTNQIKRRQLSYAWDEDLEPEVGTVD